MKGDKQMFIGVDIGGTHMRTALVDAEGGILARRRTATGFGLDGPGTVSLLALECRALAEEASRLGGRVDAVGLGVAGRIDTALGKVVFSPNLPGTNDYPLALELGNALGLPVVMENDANVFGVGESWVGAGRGVENWIGLTLGTGVGGCLILGGRLWEGDRLGFSAEIGHMIVHPEGPRCMCGSRGCLEAFCGAKALMTGIEAAEADGSLANSPLLEFRKAGTLTPKVLCEYAERQEPVARRLFDRMGWALGLALASLFSVLGIRHAIIGGGVSAGWDQFIGPLANTLRDHAGMFDADEMIVRRSLLLDDAALLGAARLAMESLAGKETGR